MDTTYRPSPRYVSGDPYHVLAALAITTITERGDRRQRAVRNTPTDPPQRGAACWPRNRATAAPRSSGSIPRRVPRHRPLGLEATTRDLHRPTTATSTTHSTCSSRLTAPPVAAITPTERNPPCNS